MTHTPGPWTVGAKDGVWVGPVVMAEDKTRGIAYVCGESAANASLIAAAPAMLTALREIAEWCEYQLGNGSDSGDLQTLRMCRDAIAKAEGRTE